jgi:hypothetical protein
MEWSFVSSSSFDVEVVDATREPSVFGIDIEGSCGGSLAASF